MPKNKLTLYIFVALVIGVITGYLYNLYVIRAVNTKIAGAEINIKNLNHYLSLLNDTTTTTYSSLKKQRTAQVSIRKENDSLRDDKLEGFTILSDIFLRLIKMIVAPLVFTTLVVGVAKVGDINAVGRIGGKTLLWFLSATLVSLLLGMLLVNLFEPGRAMHLTLPDSNINTGIKKTALSLKDFVDHVVPKSFIEAMANNEILQIVVFSLFFGIGTAAIGEKGVVVIKAMMTTMHAQGDGNAAPRAAAGARDHRDQFAALSHVAPLVLTRLTPAPAHAQPARNTRETADGGFAGTGRKGAGAGRYPRHQDPEISLFAGM